MTTYTRTSAARAIAVALAATAVCAVAPGTAAADAAWSGGWQETPTGQVSMMTVAQPNPAVTWAGGAAVRIDPADDSIRFTPALYQRDLTAGGTWQQLPLAGAESWNSRINDIATAPDGSAFFVGDQGSAEQGVLVGRYTAGRWTLTADQGLPEGTVDASLLSVSAVSGPDAWAVGQGYREDTYAAVPVVQHWDGRRWQSVTIPGSANWTVNQVDELAPDDVWVVGVDEDNGQSLAVHWDGVRWTRTPTPQFAVSSVLFDVVARRADDVWAVGWSRDTDKQRPAGLALHWNGKAWSEVPLPAGTFALQSAALRPHGGLAVVGGIDDGAVGLSWTAGAGWQSLGLPGGDTQLPLGVAAVAANGSHLTVAGWRYESSEYGDSFSSGLLLTR